MAVTALALGPLPLLTVRPTPTGTAAPIRPVSTVTPCSQGLVALTFDDGPSVRQTPELLDLLERLRAPATFFVVGQRVDAAPWVVRDMSARGFGVANHTYAHERLTRLGDSAVRATLTRTERSNRAAGARTSGLMRPPYGLIDDRVRSVVRDTGLTPVMWTVDPRDWTGVSADVIADRVLSQLRPNKRNVVLQHDGIANSPSSIRAVPRIVRAARARGYCFAALNRAGRPAPPVPAVSVRNARAVEGRGVVLRFRVRLDRPTSRPTSISVRTVAQRAREGQDYLGREGRLGFAVGQRVAQVTVRVLDDQLDERSENLTLRLSAPLGLSVRRGRARGTILDDDPLPRISLRDASVTEPLEGAVDARVVVTLATPSGRWVEAEVRTEPGTADVRDHTPVLTRLRFRPGSVKKVVRVPVLADDLVEGPEQLTVRITSLTNAVAARGTASVTILPPETEPTG